MLSDVETVQAISKTRLVGYLPLRRTGEGLRRKDADELYILVPILELMNVLEKENGAHV
jgi:hypothetical protein